MSSGSGRDLVWVCSVGFKADRAVAGLSPDVKRVHLITQNEPDLGASHVVEARGLLEARGVAVQVHSCDLFDPVSCFEVLNRVIADEARRGSIVVFNLTPGGTVMGAVGFFVASLHGFQSIYVKAAEYGNDGRTLSRGENGGPIVFPIPPKKLPTSEELAALEYLHGRGGSASEALLKRHLKDWVQWTDGARDRTKSQSANIRALIEALEKQGLLHHSPGPGTPIILTDYGRLTRNMFHTVLPPRIAESNASGRPSTPKRKAGYAGAGFGRENSV